MYPSKAIEQEVNAPQWKPYYGFHDEHRGRDLKRDPELHYRPAVQQVRQEFYDFVDAITMFRYGSLLQLGIGPIACSHFLWGHVVEDVTSIDSSYSYHRNQSFAGRNTHSADAGNFARNHGPYDVLFIDAGHSYADVEQDFRLYAPLVVKGGIIAFHDALPRKEYPEIEVHEFLKTLEDVHMIGDEVGTAWIRKH